MCFKLQSVILAGFTLLVGKFGVVEGACPIRRANSAFYLTHEVYDDTFDRLNERLGLNVLLRNPFSAPICAAPQCSTVTRYRSYSGACTSADIARKPLIGARHQCHRRLLPPSYNDRVSRPPNWVDVATIFNEIQYRQRRPNFSTEGSSSGMFAMVGQFFANDITETAISKIVDIQQNFDCCDQPHRFLPQCSMRIDVSEAISYENADVNCMSFIRAARCPCGKTMLRESMNLQTAYIDLSHVYGDGNQRDTKKPWRLASSEGPASNDLPVIDPKPAVCYGEKCFKGDRRINQQQGVSLHHVVFERLHNQMADELRIRKSSWSHNRIFEQARRLVIARWQYVIFNDFLTVLIDSNELHKRKLRIDDLMKGTQPDPQAQAVTYVESVHSALREHGLIPDTLDNELFTWLNSTMYFSDDNFIHKNSIAQWSSPGKPFFPLADSVSHNVLRHPDESIGLSLLLIDIQRSRDTGVPSFKALMEWAYNTTIDSFDSVAKLNVYTKDDLELLRSIYADSVEMVDMIVAGHLQLPHGTGIMPFIHQRINLEQLFGQVYGDRFFFSHRNVFTQEQREAIADASQYSQILCDTLKLEEVAESPFLFRANPALLRCTEMKPFNYEAFI